MPPARCYLPGRAILGSECSFNSRGKYPLQCNASQRSLWILNAYLSSWSLDSVGVHSALNSGSGVVCEVFSALRLQSQTPDTFAEATLGRIAALDVVGK